MATPQASVASEHESAVDDQWVVDDGDQSDDDDNGYPIDEYQIVTTPNDFNTRTLVDFIDSGVVMIPGFQRNFVWDVKRASRLIESLIVGLPIPQIFLYEQDKNKFLVIDGQQRLMSIYYFVKGRFPRKNRLADLRFQTQGISHISPELLANNEYFTDFALNLPGDIPGRENRLHRLKYEDLDEGDRTSFDLRTIRHIIVLQVKPEGNEAMYEIFNRLNSGGVTLTAQEIRRCAYDSDFYDMLYETNVRPEWRRLVGRTMPDIHMKDVEILLRGFAMLLDGDDYRPSMTKFLNKFSKRAQGFHKEEILNMRTLLDSFLRAAKGLDVTAFHNLSGRFSPMVFEAVFVAACDQAVEAGWQIQGAIEPESLRQLKADPEFQAATQQQTAATRSVALRLDRAAALLEVT